VLSGYVGNVLSGDNGGAGQVLGGVSMEGNVCNGALC
jgi:hypothetical protein